jgi:DNA primase
MTYTQRQVDEARGKWALWRLIERDGVKLKKRGREHVGLCPFHTEKTPSFSVVGEKGFYHCFGCGAHGSAIDWRIEYHGETFREAMAMLLGGDMPEGNATGRAPAPRQIADDDAQCHREHARSIARGSRPIDGTPGEGYFRGKRITIPLPLTLLWNPALHHEDIRGIKRVLPGIVALVEDLAGDVIAIHRIYLDPASFARPIVTKTPFMPKRKLLGPPRGGAIRLAAAAEKTGLIEGVEKGLAVMQAEPTLPVWVAIASGFMPLVKFPDHVRVPLLLADRDPVCWKPGPLYGARPGEYFARRACAVFRAEGRRPLMTAPPGDVGDFEDELLDQL